MELKDKALVLKALGDENRLAIVSFLFNQGEICACKLMDVVSCGQATLSHHLSVLSENNIVSFRKEGTKVIYKCNRKVLDEALDIYGRKNS